MDDLQVRLQAAVGEGQQCVVLLTQRCMNLAGEIASANVTLAELRAKIAELEKKVPKDPPNE